MKIEELVQKHDGSRFQEELGNFITKNNLSPVVETGMGISSVYILKAYNSVSGDNNYKLYTIDPSAWFPDRFTHEKFTLFEAKSVEIMVELYIETGPWGLFLHDGCHEILEQTYEYEFAYQCLKPGGYLVTDDKNWNNNNAWTDFLAKHNLDEFAIGAAWAIQKPMAEPVLGVEVTEFGTSMDTKKIREYHSDLLAHCTGLEEVWLSLGNQKHPAFA